MRRPWLTSEAFGSAGARAGAALPAPLLEAGDRLAAVSLVVAQRYARHALAAWAAFGADGFGPWVALGEALAAASREAALAYFAVEPAALGGLERARAWCDLGRRVAEASRRLAATFFERTAPVLVRADGLGRLGAFVDTGLALHAASGWRGAFVAQAYFDAAPGAVLALGAEHQRAWADLGLALGQAVGERDFFAALPDGLGALAPEETGLFLAAVRALAVSAPVHALTVYGALPAALAGLAAGEQAAVLCTVLGLGPAGAPRLAALAPVLGAVLRAVPAGDRAAALGRVEALAPRFPDAAIAALRVLPRLYEEARPPEVAEWFRAGLALAEENPVAGAAYFALESRTSLRVLHAASTAADLGETQGVWRKLIQMMTGASVSVRGVDWKTLRPPLEEAADAAQVTLPSAIDWLPTHEDNWRVYRFLALQLAGRREFGTYDVAFGGDEASALVEDLFLLAEGVRVHHRLCAGYAGIAPEARGLLARLLDGWAREAAPARDTALDALLALALSGGRRPPWLAPEVAAVVLGLVAPLAAPEATAADSLGVARALAAVLGTAARVVEEVDALWALEDFAGGAGDDAPAGADDVDGPGRPGVGRDQEPPAGEHRLQVGEGADDGVDGGRPLSLAELRRLIEAGARITQGRGEGEGPGLPITDLLGKLSADELAALRRALGAGDEVVATGRARGRGAEGPTFFYDEWDHLIGDYRTRWCRLREIHLPGDSGEFFGQALVDYAALVPEVRRLFQRIRPEQYRVVRGLEDGEDFDLNAVVEARIDLRARRSPSTRLYRARVREARDVATLFLLDMSASTDEPLAEVRPGRPRRRIIDAIKEALVVMTEALDELGDAYAIYGFSGQGRDGVEFYPVKGFGERLSPTVKARIGGIEPRRSTRMGTALRHAVYKMGQVGARAKHLILLSDGFPQDHDYGEDRRSHVYGIRDTAAALREADAAAITPFCITVDRAGHDYLREMCDAQRYLVIDDVAALPRELPKIYGRVVRA